MAKPATQTQETFEEMKSPVHDEALVLLDCQLKLKEAKGALEEAQESARAAHEHLVYAMIETGTTCVRVGGKKIAIKTLVVEDDEAAPS